jgi:hypothetical protein
MRAAVRRAGRHGGEGAIDDEGERCRRSQVGDVAWGGCGRCIVSTIIVSDGDGS